MRPALAEEAVSTSALEGTYAAIEDVLQAEFLDPSEVSAETIEVRNYITAAETALRLMRDENLPICRRLITGINRDLLARTRGDSSDAGEFRTRQNWIGEHRDVPVTEALFVPPPEGEILQRGLDDWEAWINETPGIPTVVHIALGHYQLETLHPFIDGNGRVGRLIAVLMLITSNSLTIPLVNLSPYLEERKDTYVEQLRRPVGSTPRRCTDRSVRKTRPGCDWSGAVLCSIPTFLTRLVRPAHLVEPANIRVCE